MRRKIVEQSDEDLKALEEMDSMEQAISCDANDSVTDKPDEPLKEEERADKNPLFYALNRLSRNRAESESASEGGDTPVNEAPESMMFEQDKSELLSEAAQKARLTQKNAEQALVAESRGSVGFSEALATGALTVAMIPFFAAYEGAQFSLKTLRKSMKDRGRRSTLENSGSFLVPETIFSNPVSPFETKAQQPAKENEENDELFWSRFTREFAKNPEKVKKSSIFNAEDEFNKLKSSLRDDDESKNALYKFIQNLDNVVSSMPKVSMFAGLSELLTRVLTAAKDLMLKLFNIDYDKEKSLQPEHEKDAQEISSLEPAMRA